MLLLMMMRSDPRAELEVGRSGAGWPAASAIPSSLCWLQTPFVNTFTFADEERVGRVSCRVAVQEGGVAS